MTPAAPSVQLWRINLKPNSQQGVDAATFCIDRSIVGIGWPLDPAPTTKDDYWRRGRTVYGKGRSWSAAANAMLNRVRVGDLMWTRNRQGVYFLGRVADDWRHENGPEFLAANIATRRCVMLPSTCKSSTMAVECLFTTLDEGKRIGLQVKSGSTPINQDNYATFDGTAYLFAASGQYLGGPHPNCICLTPDTIRAFAVENSRLMPVRIQQWIKYAASTSATVR